MNRCHKSLILASTLAVLLGSTACCFAASNATQKQTAHVPTSESITERLPVEKPKPKPTFRYCPAIHTLYKHKKMWRAPGGWRSHSLSFVNKIIRFMGAQWVGVQLGHVICLYQGDESFTFPIPLQYGLLLPTPKGSMWKKRPNDYLICVSSKPIDCPFPRKKKNKAVNLRTLLRSIK